MDLASKYGDPSHYLQESPLEPSGTLFPTCTKLIVCVGDMGPHGFAGASAQ